MGRRQLGRSGAAVRRIARPRFCDEFKGGLGWVQDERMERCSHALVTGGRVWLVDPLDGEGVEERVRSLGEPAGVIQLLDRHERDCALLAERLGVPLHVVPDELPGTPFQTVRVARLPWWREVALWWPEARVLVCADALGTAHYFRARGERAGVHPFLRLTPPRRLARLDPERLLVGHGQGIHDAAASTVQSAVRGARRRLPSLVFALLDRR